MDKSALHRNVYYMPCGSPHSMSWQSHLSLSANFSEIVDHICPLSPCAQALELYQAAAQHPQADSSLHTLCAACHWALDEPEAAAAEAQLVIHLSPVSEGGSAAA